MAVNQSAFAVHVTSPKGKKVVIKPGEEVPAWALKLITNPYVLEGLDPNKPLEDQGDPDEDDDGEASDGPPPRSGKGSGVTAWRKYAAEHDVDTDGLNVDEIIARLVEEGVPVE